MPDSATIALVRAVSVKLPAELHAALSKEMPCRKVSPWSLVRQVIAHALRDREGAPPPSCADLAGDLIGAVHSVHSGRSDVATSPRLLDEAAVQESRRATADGYR